MCIYIHTIYLYIYIYNYFRGRIPQGVIACVQEKTRADDADGMHGTGELRERANRSLKRTLHS